MTIRTWSKLSWPEPDVGPVKPVLRRTVLGAGARDARDLFLLVQADSLEVVHALRWWTDALLDAAALPVPDVMDAHGGSGLG